MFGQILSSILKKRYPQLEGDQKEYGWISLDVLLEWVVWPNYLKLVQQGVSFHDIICWKHYVIF